jgi:hypothetical protein
MFGIKQGRETILGKLDHYDRIPTGIENHKRFPQMKNRSPHRKPNTYGEVWDVFK